MRRQWKGSVPTIPARCDHETGVASHVYVIQRRIMLILVAFSFTLLPIAIALFMLAVLVITRVCSTSNIGGAQGGGGRGGVAELAKHLSFGPNDKCFLLIIFPKD